MRALAFLILLAIAPVAQALDRAETARESSRTLLETHLFMDGRGMHDYPGQFHRAKLALGLLPWNAPDEDLSLQIPFVTSYVARSLHKTFGLQRLGERLIGVYETRYSNIPVTALGCVACHSGKAAGVFIVGIGNKNISNSQVGMDRSRPVEFFEDRAYGILASGYDPVARAKLERNADRVSSIVSDPSFASPTQGLIENNVVYKTFYQAYGMDYASGEKGYVNKVPHLWGMSEKRKVGKFWDAAGDAYSHGWTAAVEIINGQTHETIRKPEYLAKLERLEHAMDGLLPPPYPFGIQPGPRDRGRDVFRATCARCHGEYQRDEQGFAIFQAPKLVSVNAVGTDPTRLEFFRDPAFWEATARSEYRDLIRLSPSYRFDQPRYVAPRLDGIWARFPYLHNGSVPTLWDMLHPDGRPEVFSLEDAGESWRFDAQRVGLTTASGRELERLQERARRGARDVYWVERKGHRNIGHPFGAGLEERDKYALIEYLKSL